MSDFLIIEFRTRESTAWDHLGRFTTTPAELAQLKALLADGRDPTKALDRIPKGLLWDALDILRAEGHEARVRFPD